jgi:hypothetical protein
MVHGANSSGGFLPGTSDAEYDTENPYDSDWYTGEEHDLAEAINQNYRSFLEPAIFDNTGIPLIPNFGNFDTNTGQYLEYNLDASMGNGSGLDDLETQIFNDNQNLGH